MLPSHVIRMKEELKALQEKRNKLREFIDSSYTPDGCTLSSAKRVMLEKQLGIMNEYEEVLTIRLELEGYPVSEEE